MSGKPTTAETVEPSPSRGSSRGPSMAVDAGAIGETTRGVLTHTKATKDHGRTRNDTNYPTTRKQSRITHESDTRHDQYPSTQTWSCGNMR